ncbi:coiled-coil domain-containing protein 173 isoform X1 [Colossoma macropomum]|uniref:coiled-coil domain-containing protein 173 isoform X1 n=1 Tax=Colossoma macropomum TaxID=42526 RepID=UPI001864B256|nr:coiled-coil domain-containing protein 173 isoform X1 [Colossoma macropomum]
MVVRGWTQETLHTKVSTSVVQYGRRKGSSRKVASAEVKTVPSQPVDLRQVTVLPRSEWLRLQDSLNQVNKHKESLIEAAKQREELHLRSKEVVKNWTNTIAGQRQKKLEAKKNREEAEEEERKRIDIEEAKFQEQKRKEAIEMAKTRQYYQTNRVKEFHSALLLTEVLKEREAQIELKRRKQNASKDVDKEVLTMIACREEQATQQEHQKALQRKQECLSVAENLKQQIKEHERAREQDRMEQKKEAEELQRLRELYLREQYMHEQKKQEEKINIMRAHQEHLANRDEIQAIEAQKQKEEEDRQRLYASAKEKMMKLRKEKEAELFREMQRHREAIIERLSAQHQEQTTNEDNLISKAVAEAEAKRAQHQREKDAKKAAMLKSIAAHREAVQQEQEHKEQEEKQKAVEMLNAKKEADKIFLEKQQLKAQKMKEYARSLQDTYVHQMAEKREQDKRMKKEQWESEASNAALIAEEENQFQQYAKHVIQTATEAQRNTYPLRKAAREGIGGGLGPVFGGVRPSYLVHDESGVQMPGYVSSTTQGIKELNETIDIQQSKKRLGFTW